MHTYLIEMLECPACHSKLDWDITEQSENRIEMAATTLEWCVLLATSTLSLSKQGAA